MFLAVTGFAQSRYRVTEERAAGAGSPRVVVLQDGVAGVEAAFAPSQGGELSSYRVKWQGAWVELLYRARDYSATPGFQGKAPLLWPAVGGQYPIGTIPKVNCGDGTYVLDGKTYPMPCHGFVRNLPWREVRRTANASGASLTLRLRDSARTREMYPFGFLLEVTYWLTGGRLTMEYAVTADRANRGEMMFSIGNHIAFQVPFLKGTSPEEMTFETASTTQLLRNERGMLNGETQADGGLLQPGAMVRDSEFVELRAGPGETHAGAPMDLAD